MEKTTVQKTAEDLLGVEAYLARLETYRPYGKVNLKDLFRDLCYRLLGAVCGMVVIIVCKLIIAVLLRLQGPEFNVVSLVIGVLAIIMYLAYPVVAISVIIALCHGVLKQIWKTLTLTFSNQRRMRADEQNEANLELARNAWKRLMDKLVGYSVEKMEQKHQTSAKAEYFFDIPFQPEARDRADQKEYGVNYWNVGNRDVLMTCRGELKLYDQTNGTFNIHGFTQSYAAKAKEVKDLRFGNIVLYEDLDQNALKKGKVFEVRRIYEIASQQLTSTTSYTTTTSYNVDKAVRDFNSRMDLRDGLTNGPYGSSAVIREKGEREIRDALATQTSVRSDRLCAGEDLIILERGYVVYQENRLVLLCIPRGEVKQMHIVYELDSPIRIHVERGEYFASIPEEKRFRGKVLAAETEDVTPNSYATARYAADVWKNEMGSLDVMEKIPSNITDPQLWRYWIQARYQNGNGRVWNRDDCMALVRDGGKI